jgi:hypothetical protein
VPSAIARHVRALEQRGWLRAQIRERLTGIQTADKPGAAAITRLSDLATAAIPSPQPERPPWCGHCDQRTRLREDADNEDRPYACPRCHHREANHDDEPSRPSRDAPTTAHESNDVQHAN